jgi:superfamily I DNA/RNA helicase
MEKYKQDYPLSTKGMRAYCKQATDLSDRCRWISGVDQPSPEIRTSMIIGSKKWSLTTMHAAKGLEFPVVFIAGCEDEYIPFWSTFVT